MIRQMDQWLATYANITREKYPNADPDHPGTGAAGGLGFAFLSYTNAILQSGIQIILEETRLESCIKDADIVIYDKDKDFTISVDNMHSDLDHTIWEGKQLHGYPIRTYLRGNVVYDNGDFVGTPGLGEYVKRSPRKH